MKESFFTLDKSASPFFRKQTSDFLDESQKSSYNWMSNNKKY